MLELLSHIIVTQYEKHGPNHINSVRFTPHLFCFFISLPQNSRGVEGKWLLLLLPLFKIS